MVRRKTTKEGGAIERKTSRNATKPGSITETTAEELSMEELLEAGELHPCIRNEEPSEAGSRVAWNIVMLF